MYVATTGSDTLGNGSLAHPFATLDGALAHLKWKAIEVNNGSDDEGDDDHHDNGNHDEHDEHDEHDDDEHDNGNHYGQHGDDGPVAYRPVTIHLGAGDFAAAVNLSAPTIPTGASLRIEGTSATATHLIGVAGKDVLSVSASAVSFADFSLDGGLRGLVVSGVSNVTAERLAFTNNTRAAVLIRDGATAALADVDIRDVYSQNGVMGWGVGVQNATATLTNVTITRATQAGLFADHAIVDLLGCTIQDTRVAGLTGIGRGVHAQYGTALTIVNSTFLNNMNTGVFGLDLSFLEVDGVLIDMTGVGIRTGGLGNGVLIDMTGVGINPDGVLIDMTGVGIGGDGIVLAGSVSNPFDAVVTSSTIAGSTRAAIIVDSANATVTSNLTVDNGLTMGGTSTFSQGTATTSGTDTVIPLTTSLGLRTAPLALDIVP